MSLGERIATHNMLAAWNESDPEKVRSHLDRALAPDVVFIDPSVVTRGIDERMTRRLAAEKAMFELPAPSSPSTE